MIRWAIEIALVLSIGCGIAWFVMTLALGSIAAGARG